MIDLKTPYAYQVNNINTPVANGWSQCGYTSACMFMAQYLGSNIVSKPNIALFVDWMEPSYGIKGEGEALVAQHPELAGQRLGAHIECYAPAVTDWLNFSHINGKTIIRRYNEGNWAEVKVALDSGSPVFIGTMITSSGHFILIRGYTDEGNWICNDPAGDARKGYDGITQGDGVVYDAGFMDKVTRLSDYGFGYFYWTKSV